MQPTIVARKIARSRQDSIEMPAGGLMSSMNAPVKRTMPHLIASEAGENFCESMAGLNLGFD